MSKQTTTKVNPRMISAKRKEADQRVAAGEKALQTGFFKWTPDYEIAAGEFQKAGLAFQLAGLIDEAVKAYKRAAFCHLQSKTEYSAGKNYEAAGKAEYSRKNYKDAAQLFQKASSNYCNSDNNEKAADALVEAAKAWESAEELKQSAAALEEALSIYEADDREYNAIESYKRLVGLYISIKDYKSAFTVMEKMVSVFEKLEQPHNVNTTYFHIIVLLLYTGESETANEKLNSFMNESSGFIQSEDFSLASSLIDAVVSDSGDLLQSFMKTNAHKLRERVFAKLIKNMKFLGSARAQTIPIMDDFEDRLILGTPPASPREDVEDIVPTQEEESVPSVAEPEPVAEPMNVPEVTDDDLL